MNLRPIEKAHRDRVLEMKSRSYRGGRQALIVSIFLFFGFFVCAFRSFVLRLCLYNTSNMLPLKHYPGFHYIDPMR